jgi:uncharacterized damage-inducible protein DinB
LAEAFRTVRGNTITIGEEIPEEQYGFKPSPDIRSVAETLAHLAMNTGWQVTIHGEGVTFIDFEMFSRRVAEATAAEKLLTTKAEILRALKDEGGKFASFLESLSDQKLAETVSFPPAVQPPIRTRFEMLLAAKEHEMHHRGQLMTYERMLGIVPHLTRRRDEARRAAAAAAASPASR